MFKIVVPSMEMGFDREKSRILLFFVESPDFFPWVSRFSFTRDFGRSAYWSYDIIKLTIFHAISVAAKT